MCSFTVLVIYDFLLTIPSEIKYIWQRNFGLGTLLLAIIRYTILLRAILWIPSIIHSEIVPIQIVDDSVSLNTLSIAQIILRL